MAEINVLASTCPVCGTGTPDPCTAAGQVHTARVRAALLIAAAVAALHREQHRIATILSHRHRAEAALAADPFAIQDAVFNRQVLQMAPSRRATQPYPIVGHGRNFQ